MAEERLIDDDKDRKYKIRKNADGEDELIIDDGLEEEAEELIGLEVPDFEADDEEAAVMTPEQLAARERQRQEDEERKQAKAEELIAKAEKQLALPDYEGAAYSLTLAAEEVPTNGKIYVLKLRALTRDFTDYSLLDDCADAAEGIKLHCSDEEKAALSENLSVLEELAQAAASEVERLNAENEQKKAERREILIARRKRSVIWFSVTALPFLAFLILAISFSTIMFADKAGANLILTIVFAALAVVCFIATLITAHNLWAAQKNISLNEKNSSTKLGRELEAKKDEQNKLTRIYTAIKG